MRFFATCLRGMTPETFAAAPTAGARPTLRSRARKLLALALVTLMTAAGVTVIDQSAVSPSAEAASYGAGIRIDGDWHGNYYEGASGFIYCLDKNRQSPIGVTTTFSGYTTYIGKAGGQTDLSWDILAGINMVISNYGQTTNNSVARAVNDAIWIVASGYQTQNPLSNQYAAEIRNYVAPPTNTTGSMSMTFQVNGNNNYLGTLRIATMSVSPGSGSITLTNGIFTDTGSQTRVGTFSVGQVFQIRGVPPASGVEYKISATADLSANTSSGFAWQVALWDSGAYQRMAGPGGPQQTSNRMRTTAVDPSPRSSAFFPVVATTVVTEELAPGDKFKDVLRFSVTNNGEGTTNDWPRGSTGNYYQVTSECTVYGPFADRPVQSADVPAEAPKAGTFSVTTTTASGPTIPYQAESNETMDTGGFYTAVCVIDYNNQPRFTQNFLVDQYYFQDDFGQVVETSIVPSSLDVVTQMSVNSTPIGEEGLSDNVSASVASGFWMREGGTSVPVTANGTWYYSATEPVQGSSVPAGAEVIHTASATLTGENVPVSSPAPKMPYRAGWVTARWCIEPSTYVQASCDDYGVPAETIQLLSSEFSTVAIPAAAPGDEITDTATVAGTVPTAGMNLTFTAYHQADPAAAAVCDAGNLVFTSSTTLVTQPGDITSDPMDVLAEHVGTIAWVLTARTADTDELLYTGACGDPAEMTAVGIPTVSTVATLGGSLGSTVGDVAFVDGSIAKSGLELMFAAYLQTAVGAQECSAETLIYASEFPIAVVEPGEYPSEQFTVAPEHVGQLLWVETATMRNAEGDVVWEHVGLCGQPEETTWLLDVTTEATQNITSVEQARDTAFVVGPVEQATAAGQRVELYFEAFRSGEETCSAADLLYSTEDSPQVLKTAGTYESPLFSFTAPGKVYWVATVNFIGQAAEKPIKAPAADPTQQAAPTSSANNVQGLAQDPAVKSAEIVTLVHMGDCGEPAETTTIELAYTGSGSPDYLPWLSATDCSDSRTSRSESPLVHVMSVVPLRSWSSPWRLLRAALLSVRSARRQRRKLRLRQAVASSAQP